ncbi:MAG: IS630 family transposase [Acidobacteria bacterium Pan2503]|uniref:IS630 family transposase n=1 Tax=Candidatus Acidiferrum panamense TaxID=2741543 RepID=A0A7V8NNL8_9BACT|nr:IS630 family transposase [Candidatus Acidoferrum panamensis]
MARTPAHIELTSEEETTLRHWTRQGTSEQRLVERARVVLLSHEGLTVEKIAERLDTRPARVSKWRQRFMQSRLEGLSDAPRSGKPNKYTEHTEERVLKTLDEPPPKGWSQWNGKLLAQRLRDVSEDHVWRILRRRGIQLQRRRSWCITTDPEFGPKAADVVGLYLNPPEKAVVVCVDEKPHIQALQRAQGYLRLPDGKAVNGFSHCYKRHGTTTLFAALDVATGQVKTGHYTRRRRREFLDFRNEIVAENPARTIHVILDNLNTHKPKRDRWLKLHPQVHLHYTPTYSSWLNQVECWFSILSRAALRGASFTSPRQLRDAIDAFVQSYNQTATPFEWTKAVVHPTGPKQLYSDLCK